MPFKSKAQVRKFDHLLSEGKITQAQFDQWHAETPNIKKLPARVKKAKKKSFSAGFKKVAENMADRAALESGLTMQEYVPGTSLRNDAETGQAKGRATRTFNVQNEDKQFSSKYKVKYDTARFGRRNHVS